ncbi:ABC transporter substrate-binding protein [Methylobacterium platani]|uniref:Amino acid ABC transporter substrate-binding protein n=2 Tax=Methylobacterium platani TaxID=427683 RepID=A0A179SD67_9HYPH|nr:ABC transporter substrate-binding protein [Methylobacterium platani]KMO10755.1 amino acid ABC transporter substrate-binding protein [Methylobacterium platani JCM 14648]OAS24425.1 amino acid ABC transporter substrate-binding protein [Methylobacterium platani]
MHRRDVLLGGAAALAAVAGARPARAAEEVLIGAVYPMSGANAQVGVDGRHALETAIEIVNGVHDLDLPGARAAGLAGLGGAKIRLVMADHQADPQKGRSEAERLITQNKVAGIVGTYHSSVAATVSVTCERYGVPFVAADSSSPSLHRRNLKYFFRPAAHDEMFSAAIFDLLDAERKKGAKVDTVALFYEDTIFGVDSSTVQRKLAAERGYKVAADVKYRSNSPSLTAEVQQLKSADADVVLPSSYTTDSILLVKTMAELGYKPRNMIAQAAGFAEKATFESVGDKLDGLISRASFALDLAKKRPSIGVVNEMYKARAGRDLNDNTSRLVEAMLVLADGIDRARSLDGAKIREALAATKTPAEQTIMPWRGIAFGPDGQNVLCDPVLIQYRGGTFVTVFPEAFAAAAPKWPMNG